MVTLSQNRLVSSLGMVTLAIVIVTVVGGVEFLPILILLALSIPLLFYFTETERESEHDENSPSEAHSDPLMELRRQFATGRIDDEEFERRLDLLLETEAPGDRELDRDLVRE